MRLTSARLRNPVPFGAPPAGGHRRLPAATVVAALALGGCASHPAGHYYQDDGPPQHVPAGLGSVPDAVPRDEPLNPRANRPYTALGHSYTPDTGDAPFDQRGIASWYGRQYHGSRTASGEPYDMFAMTAAHPTLPIPSYARVTNVRDGRSVVVRINDRGPFLQDRVIDLSYAAATRLGLVGPGSGEVQVHKITAQERRSGWVPPLELAVPAAAPAASARAFAAPPPPAVVAAELASAPAAAAAAGTAVAGAAARAPVAVGSATVKLLAQEKAAPIAVSSGSVEGTPAPAPASLAEPGALARPTSPASDAAAQGGAARPAAEAMPAPAAPPAGPWSVQFGAFSVEANALALRDEIDQQLAEPEGDRLPAEQRHPRIVFDGRLHRVLVGGFAERAAALAAAKVLQGLLAHETTVVRH